MSWYEDVLFYIKVFAASFCLINLFLLFILLETKKKNEILTKNRKDQVNARNDKLNYCTKCKNHLRPLASVPIIKQYIE